MEIAQFSTPLEWEFLAKGNANVIYRYCGNNEIFRRKVLRVRLDKPPGQYITTLELNQFMKARCQTKFQRHYIHHELVHIDTAFLSRLETKNFILMASEKYGFLMEDILFGDFKTYILSKHCKLHVEFADKFDKSFVNSVIFELKPKWLYDNKTTYCRNCALNQQRKYVRHFCPLDFLSKSTIQTGIDDLLFKIPEEISSLADKHGDFKLRRLLEKYLDSPENVFQVLKNNQEIKKQSDFICNVESEDDISDTLLFAMTIRDVGVFIKFSKSLPEKIEMGSESDLFCFEDHDEYIVTTHLYDFDLKSKSKYEHWKNTDMKLREFHNSYNSTWRPCIKSEQSS